MVTAICGIAIPAGNLVAFIWVGTAFKGAPAGPEFKDTLRKMLINMNSLITAIAIPMIIFIRAKPEFYPSKVARKKP